MNRAKPFGSPNQIMNFLLSQKYQSQSHAKAYQGVKFFIGNVQAFVVQLKQGYHETIKDAAVQQEMLAEIDPLLRIIEVRRQDAKEERRISSGAFDGIIPTLEPNLKKTRQNPAQR